MAVGAEAITKKAVVEWSPSGEPFQDPMLDHAALIELQLLDRIVFVCDSSAPSVIYKVSEESFAECKYDSSAEWIGECSRGLKYVTVFLRNGPTQTVFYPNKTYFFTSFSSGTRYGVRDRSGGLCERGVRLILELRDSSARIPLKPGFSNGLQELQVPVQRVAYGGMSEKPHHRRRNDEQLLSMGMSFPFGGSDSETKSYLLGTEEEDNNGLFGWLQRTVSREIVDDDLEIQKRRLDNDYSKWGTFTSPDFFQNNAAKKLFQWSMISLIVLVMTGI